MSTERIGLLASAVAVCAALTTGCVFIVRALIAKDSKPVGDAMIGLTGEVKALRETIELEREDRRTERKETQAWMNEIHSTVQDHSVRIAVLEQPTPPAASARKRRIA